ncbi:MAG: flagellar type III secretion system protein FlhB [Gammaproteobacteria bacterium]|nr:flagellar type III secretion system protein FlhB [Gammaproteobacteria bacterium]
MAEHEDGQERTEQPTERRLQRAREQGQVARSRELANLGLLLTAAAGLMALGPATLSGLVEIVRRGLTPSREVLAGGGSDLLSTLAATAADALFLLLPLLAALLVVAVLAPLALGGWTFSTEALALKPERLNPVKGLARVFSLNGLAELAKALAKFTVLALTAGLLLWRDMGSILSLGTQGLAPALSGAASLLLNSFLVLCGALVSIAALDVPYQYWRHHQQLRMNRQDLREELKETEGKPEVKSRQRMLQREVARRRMMQEVPRADVVVTNPTHFAVALRYRPESMAAPRVVAKGADLVAQRIRELAAEHGVPLLSAPPLARALYHGTRLGQEIPAGLYQAVAQVLAYVYALRRQRREGGVAPVPPTDLPVPDGHAVRGEEISE